jgi:hypothetical protein
MAGQGKAVREEKCKRSEAALLNKISSNHSFGIYLGKKSEISSKKNFSIFKPGLSVKCCFAARYADLTG